MSDAMQRTVELVNQAQGGDRAAVEELLQRYASRLRAIVRVRLSKDARRLCDSQDVMQDVMLRAVGRIGSFEMRDENSFLHWLGTIAANHVRDLVDAAHADRRDVRRETPQQGGDDGSTRILEPAGHGETPSQEAAKAELADIMDECIRSLPEHQRELVLMRDFAGMAWDAIGSKIGVSADAARMQYGTAKAALGRRLQARGIGPSA